MKKILIVLILSAYCKSAEAQLLDRIKNRVEQKVVDKVDQSIDKATQKKKTSEKPKETTPSSSSSSSESSTGTSQESSSVNSTEKTESVKTASSANTESWDITAYSKFDFIPGQKIIIQEDFAQEEVGDFPSNWNTRSGAEVVTVGNRKGKWLRMNQTGVFYPENALGNLPENFTLQLELMANQHMANIGQFMISLLNTENVDEKFKWGEEMHLGDTPNFKLSFQPVASGHGQMHYSTNLIGSQHKNNLPEFELPEKGAVKIAVWRQKQRVRVYLDSTKVLDLPRALEPSATLNALVFSASNPDYQEKDGAFFLSNIQLAVGASDTRNKLINEGKFTTHGILFDTNSDVVKPQSYGSIREIAQLLTDNAGVRVKIIGHTDADGNDQSNLDLSKRRALAVKQTLVKTFGIDESRLENDGKGKAQPIDSNDTQVGKANNRRVEFVKL